MIREQVIVKQIERQIARLSRQQQLEIVARITQQLTAKSHRRANGGKRGKYATDVEKIKQEQAWWMKQSEKQRLKYAGAYVAVHNQTLIDHDDELAILSRRIRAKYGKIAVLMMPAEGPREIRLYSTRVIRNEDSI